MDGSAAGRALLAELLARTAAELVLAAPRESILTRLRGELEPEQAARVTPYRLDLRDGRGVQAVIERVRLAISAPALFRGAPPGLARAALCAGVDYVDLSGRRDGVLETLALERELFPDGDGPAVAPAFALTALAGALTSLAARDLDEVLAVRVTVVPGPGFPSGLGEHAYAVAHASRPVRALRQGIWCTVPGWSEPAAFRFPAPLGLRTARLVDAADGALLAEPTGTRRIELRLDERALSGPGLAALARLRGAGVPFGSRGLAGGLALLGSAVSGRPAPAAAVGVELEGRFGRHALRVRASALDRRGLGPLAALPAAYVAARLVDSGDRPLDPLGHASWIAPEALLEECRRSGIELALERE